MERPDYDDYDQAAQDAVRMSGLPDAQELYWDYEARPNDNLGIVANFDLTEVDTDYLTESLAAIYPGPVDRQVHMRVYSHNNDSLTPERNAFISVALTDVEAEAAVALLIAREGDDFWDDSVSYWRNGDVRGMMGCFAFTPKGLRETWDAIGAAVHTVSPHAGQHPVVQGILGGDFGGFIPDYKTAQAIVRIIDALGAK